MTTQLSTLTGTDKQIAWATDIRRDAITYLEMIVPAYDELIARNEASPLMIRTYVALRDRRATRLVEVMEQTSAAWFIENRAQVVQLGPKYFAELAASAARAVDYDYAFGGDIVRSELRAADRAASAQA